MWKSFGLFGQWRCLENDTDFGCNKQMGWGSNAAMQYCNTADSHGSLWRLNVRAKSFLLVSLHIKGVGHNLTNTCAAQRGLYSILVLKKLSKIHWKAQIIQTFKAFKAFSKSCQKVCVYCLSQMNMTKHLSAWPQLWTVLLLWQMPRQLFVQFQFKLNFGRLVVLQLFDSVVLLVDLMFWAWC